MKKIFVALSLFFCVFMCGLNIVRATEIEDIFIKRFTTSEVAGYLSSYSSNGRPAFFGDGVVTAVKVKSNSYALYYYDMDGKLINKTELENSGVIYYMEEHDNFLYVSTDSYLYKLDRKLNQVASLEIETFLPISGAHGTKNIGFDKDKILLYDEDYNWYDGVIYAIDYDLKESSIIASENKNESEYKKYENEYFRDIGRYPPVSVSYKDESGLIQVISGLTGTKTDEIRHASLTIIKTDSNGEEIFNKNIVNEDYYEFYMSRVVENYVITVAAKYPDSIMEKPGAMVSDILIYDLEGNYIKTIAVDKIVNYLNATEDAFVISTQVYDGVCEENKYYYNDGCDILTNVSVYSFPIEEVEIPEDNPPEEIENPETAAFLVNNISIICLLIMGLGAIIIANKSFRKIRFLR